MWKSLRQAVMMIAALTILTGIVYPLLITGIAVTVFPAQAAGSLLTRNGRVVGSRLIGQSFSDPRYFWGRPSATTPQAYNAAASGGSNLGPLNPALTVRVKQAVAALREADPGNPADIPVDLVTTSASGLDPDITPAAAYYQAQRVARARGLTPERVRRLVELSTEPPALGFIGEARVNVLVLNLRLDQLK